MIIKNTAKKYMHNILPSIKLLVEKGFFHIFNTTVINSVVAFIYGIFIIRILNKSDYASFSYAQNISNFAVMFAALGMPIGILQYCSEDVELSQKLSFSKHAALRCILGSIIVLIPSILYTYIDKSGIKDLQLLVLAFTLLPFMFSTREWIAANLRWQFRNKEYGHLMNLNSILNAILAVLGAKFLGVYGVILGINLSYAATITLGLFYLRKDIKAILSSPKINKKMQSSFDKYSLTMCLTNVLISILFTIDLFVIGNIVKNPEQIANYKAACVIPFALNMIPNAVMTFLFPYFSKNKENIEWLKRNIKKLYIANGITNSIIGLCLIILAPLLINIIFGKQYLDIVIPFRLLTVSYIVSACLRTPSANLLAMLKKTKMALCISAASVALCVIMDIILVSSFGIIGAACSSVIAFSIVGIVSCCMIMLFIYKRQPVAT